MQKLKEKKRTKQKTTHTHKKTFNVVYMRKKIKGPLRHWLTKRKRKKDRQEGHKKKGQDRLGGTWERKCGRNTGTSLSSLMLFGFNSTLSDNRIIKLISYCSIYAELKIFFLKIFSLCHLNFALFCLQRKILFSFNNFLLKFVYFIS